MTLDTRGSVFISRHQAGLAMANLYTEFDYLSRRYETRCKLYKNRVIWGGYGVTRGQRQRHSSIECIRFAIQLE